MLNPKPQQECSESTSSSPHQNIEILDNPEMVKGDPELPGFVLQMAKIW
jgi:hypothetical protein